MFSCHGIMCAMLKSITKNNLSSVFGVLSFVPFFGVFIGLGNIVYIFTEINNVRKLRKSLWPLRIGLVITILGISFSEHILGTECIDLVAPSSCPEDYVPPTINFILGLDLFFIGVLLLSLQFHKIAKKILIILLISYALFASTMILKSLI